MCDFRPKPEESFSKFALLSAVVFIEEQLRWKGFCIKAFSDIKWVFYRTSKDVIKRGDEEHAIPEPLFNGQ